MRITIDAPDNPLDAANYVATVADQIARGVREGYCSLHKCWIASGDHPAKVATAPEPPAPSFDPAWDKSPEEIARIQALPNRSRLK